MVPTISDTVLEKICHVLAEAVSHTELTSLLNGSNIAENGGNPKWERMKLALSARQRTDRCGNNVVAFVQSVMNPVRFIGRQDFFIQIRDALNEVLSFAGLSISDDGNVRSATKARTLSEAAQRAGKLRRLLEQRSVHADVLSFCREELVQENYFHAVFEATKSVADKIRSLSGLELDGAELVDTAFSVKNPILAINSLRTETEESEHKGFANLLKGMFGTFRNVTAHAPKIRWTIEEQDALDLLTIVSFLHRRLDKAVKVPRL